MPPSQSQTFSRQDPTLERDDKFIGFESILSSFLSVCKCLPREVDVPGDVDGVAGGLVVVVRLVLGPDAVGRDVPLEHHGSDLTMIWI